MAKNISQQEYWDEVRNLAKEAHDMVVEDETRDLGDMIHELVDGHEWVIYTAYNFDVLKHTESDSEIEDLFGDEKVGDGWHALLGKAAYAALAGDVRAQADAISDEDGDESDED